MNSIEKIISKALIDSDISHEELRLVIKEEQNYLRLKESIQKKDSQLGDIERDRLIEHGKRTGINEKLKQNERQSLKFKTEVWNLLKLQDNVIILFEVQKE